MPDYRKTNLMRQIEKQYPETSIEEILVKAFARCGSLEAVAEDLGVHIDTLRYWLPAMGISIRRVTVAETAGEREAVTV